MLKWGSKDHFDNSMADAIEHAFGEVWLERGFDALPASPDAEQRDDKRMLYLAIARGVIRHLRDNADAFKVTIDLGSFGTVTGTLTIEGAEQ